MATKKRKVTKSKKVRSQKRRSKSGKTHGPAAYQSAPAGHLTSTFLVRFTTEEHALVRRAAYEEARSGAAFIRNATLIAIGEKLLKLAPKAAAEWKAKAVDVATEAGPQ